MGNCSSNEVKATEKQMESVDPPVAEPEPVVPPAAVASAPEPEAPHPAPITVDLHKPDVDVSAPLDERDIDLVQQTFGRVAMLGTENVGWVVFMNIFEIAPPALGLFSFKDDVDKKGSIKNSTKMKAHASKVVSTLATAVSLLRDLPTLVPVLHGLGLKHVGYGVIPAHYDVVGQAIIKSLGTALGDKFTPAVMNAYLKVFTIVKTTMLEKCDYSKLAAPEPAPAPADAEAAEAAKKKKVGEPAAKATTRKAPAAKASAKKAAGDAEDKKKAEADEKKKKDEEAAAAAEDEQNQRMARMKAASDRKKAWNKLEKGAQEELLKALAEASDKGDVPKLKELLEKSVDVDAFVGKIDLHTPLHYAAIKNHVEFAKILLDNMADPKGKIVVNADTPLHIAAKNNAGGVAELLNLAKCVSAKNNQGKTAMEIAKASNASDVIKVLKKAAKK